MKTYEKVYEAEEGLVVLHAGHQDHVPKGIKLGPGR
jgi:hypothetical protein